MPFIYCPSGNRSWAKLLKYLWDPTHISWQRKWRGSETIVLCAWQFPEGKGMLWMPPKMWVPEVGRAWQVGTLSALRRVCSWGLQQFHPSHNFWPCKATTVVAAIHMMLPLSSYLFFPFPVILGLPKDHFRVSQPPDVLHVDISYSVLSC